MLHDDEDLIESIECLITQLHTRLHHNYLIVAAVDDGSRDRSVEQVLGGVQQPGAVLRVAHAHNLLIILVRNNRISKLKKSRQHN